MLTRRSLVVAGALLAAAPPPLWAAPSPPDIERVLKRGRLVVGLTATDVPPFVSTGDDGMPQGHDVDLARGMAAALSLAVEFERRGRTPEELVGFVAEGAVDLALSRLSVTLDRALKVRFSRPYLVLRQALLLNRPRFAQSASGSDPAAVANAPEAILGVVAGGGYEALARRFLPRASVRAFPRWDPDIIDRVMSGELWAGYADEILAQRSLAVRADAPLRLRAAALGDARDAIAVALPWESAGLHAWVDLYLETMPRPLSVADFLGASEPRSGR